MSAAEAETTLRAFLRRNLGEEPSEQLSGKPLRAFLDRVRGRIDRAESQLVDLVGSSQHEIDETLAFGEQVAAAR